MEIRKIKPEEMAAVSVLRSLVYLIEESEDYKDKLANPTEHSDGYEDVWAVYENGKMCSVTSVLNYKMRFDGHTVPMGGVAGVATLAEERGKGYVRRIFEAILNSMYEEGKLFSFLYPFSFDFYRKFGYELCYTPDRASVPAYLFQEYPIPKRAEQVFPGEGIAELLRLYGAFTADKNFALVRGEEEMIERTEQDPYIKMHYTYLNRDANGTPDGYMLCNTKDGDDGRVLNIREMAWSSPQGMQALFGLIGGLSPEYGAVRWDVPGGVCLGALFGDGFELDIKRPSCGMSRIVNVTKVFELIKAPGRPGSVTFRVTDDTLPVNSGTYRIEWEGGRVTSVKPANTDADLVTDIQTLSQLAAGFITPREAALKRGTSVNGNLDALSGLFPKKDMFIAEHF
jgi:predicted acetyltransferase